MGWDAVRQVPGCPTLYHKGAVLVGMGPCLAAAHSGHFQAEQFWALEPWRSWKP